MPKYFKPSKHGHLVARSLKHDGEEEGEERREGEMKRVKTDVIRKHGEVPDSYVEWPVSHQLEVGPGANKSEEGFK